VLEAPSPPNALMDTRPRTRASEEPPDDGVLARITDQHLRDVGFEQIVQPSGAGSFFQGHVHTTVQAANKLENRFGFRFEDT
jgi:hypothetical protein